MNWQKFTALPILATAMSFTPGPNTTLSVLRFAIVLPVMLAYAFGSSLSYALMGSLLRDWLAGPLESGRRLALFNLAMALVLVVTAVWMLLT